VYGFVFIKCQYQFVMAVAVELAETGFCGLPVNTENKV
jgi:hypothetical protein